MPLTQVQEARLALERGEVLTMMSMLMDYGIGNHTDVIMKVRRQYEKEGKGYDYVKMEYVYFKSKKTGRQGRYAKYFIEK